MEGLQDKLQARRQQMCKTIAIYMQDKSSPPFQKLIGNLNYTIGKVHEFIDINI